MLRAKSLAQQGHLSRATKVLFQDGLAPINESTINDLKALHPTASDPVPSLPADSPQLQLLDSKVIISLIKALANGSSPAGSGWTGDLLKALSDDSDC